MKFKITLMLLLIASMLKAQETRIVFNAPASTPADATVTLMIWTAIEYEPGQWLGFGDVSLHGIGTEHSDDWRYC